MDFPKKQQQCLIPRYLLQYLTSLQTNHDDPTAPWGGGGGGTYTAGDGIEISDEDVISIDDTVALKSDIPSLTGYATETWVTNQGYSTFSGSYNDLTNKPDLSIYETKAEAFSGDYNDLTNKPTIPTDTSDLTNGAGYITSSALTNYVTTNTSQEITGDKTFVGRKMIKFKQLYSTDKLGFTGYDNNNAEVGYLEMNKSDNDFGSKTSNVLGIYDNSNAASDKYVGFKYYKNKGSDNNKHVVELSVPPLYANKNSGSQYIRYIPIDFTDGTNTVRSDATGVVDLSSLNLGGSSYTAGTGIDITNDVISIDSTVVALKSDIPTVPTNVSSFTNDAGYITGITSSDVTTALGYTPGTSNFSGNYNDLTNKPTIPDAVSGTNDGTNWTSLTIGSDTYGLASGSTPANMVTTDTAQDINGVKTFTNEMVMSSTSLGLTKPNGIYFSNLDNCFDKGLYAFSLTSYTPQSVVGEVTFNYVNNITRNGKSGTFEYYTLLGNGRGIEGQYESPSCVGFQINRRVSGTTTKKYFLAPRPSFSDSWNSAYDTYDAYYIPIVISDGTTNYYANEQGIVTIPAGGSSYTAGTGIDITNNTISIDSTVVALKSDIPTVPTNVSAFTNDAGYITGITSSDVTTALGYTPGTSDFSGSYNDLTDKPTIPDAVSGTNDGTNWTSLTIGSDTYGIPSGGGGTGSTITKYDTSSYMTNTNWSSNKISYAIWDGYPDSNEFIIENTNPGDILFIDVSLDYYINGFLYSKRYTFKTVVPIKSPDSLPYRDSYKSTAYEFYNEGATSITNGFIRLDIANRSNTTSNRRQIGSIYLPVALSTTDSRNKVTVNFITHIAA